MDARRLGLVRIVFLACCVVCSAFVFAGVPAFAAALEAPGAAPSPPGSVSALTATSATLNGVLNPNAAGELGTYEFLYAASGSQCEGGGLAPQPAGMALGVEKELVSVGVAGLSPSTQYTFCLLARNATEQVVGAPVTFTTLAQAPTVSGESSREIGSRGAGVSAQVDAGGASTGYHVEYVTEAQFVAHEFAEATDVPSPDANMGAPSGAVEVRAQLNGLLPGTVYHFRFVASNSLKSGVLGEDVTFTTTPSVVGGSSSALPDNRVYEMVSSPSDDQEIYLPEQIGELVAEPETDDIAGSSAFRAAADGEAVTFIGDPPLTAGEGGTFEIGKGRGNEYLAKRGPGGWKASDIAPVSTGNGSFYQYFSSDLSSGIFWTTSSNESILSASPLAPAGCEEALYLRDSDGGFHSLYGDQQPQEGCGIPVFDGESGDGSELLFASEAHLTANAPLLEETEEGTVCVGSNLYESVDGKAYLVNVLPDGQVEQEPDTASFGSPSFEECSDRPDLSNVISADGSRIFWSSMERAGNSTKPNLLKALYARENGNEPQSPIGGKGECLVSTDACTVELDVAQPGATGSDGGGRFWTSYDDESRVLFTDDSKLTSDSNAGPGEPDLYQYDFEKPVGERLTDLTPQAGANVQGVIGASETGSYVYFVASGALAPGASARQCGAARLQGTGTPEDVEREEELRGILPQGRGCNLYVLHSGETKLVSALSGEDNSIAHGAIGSGGHEFLGDWRGSLGERTAELTPDGRSLVFLSKMGLTGYDNARAATAFHPNGQVAEPEVYVYSAETGGLACASCNPNGTPPDANLDGAFLAYTSNSAAAFMPRLISDDGSRVFFVTGQALVPQDTNGLFDVYEWERDGTGSCEHAAGCVYLLSGGQSIDASYPFDASANGDDVFFISRAQLVSQDHNENMAVYDARVDGGFPEISLACTGTGCQGVPPAPPIFATPSSVTFNGVGNFEPSPPAVVKKKARTLTCKKGQVKKDGRCVKRKARAKKSGKRSKRGSK
jgi:hypothetical protein